MKNNRLQENLNEYLRLKTYFKKNHSTYTEIDAYGFLLNTVQKNKKYDIDLFLTGLTHGNETIGLQIINLVLEEIIKSKLNIKIGFMLNNIEAYLKDIRFNEYDLNRSFLIKRNNCIEHKRAEQIEKVIDQLNIKLLLDLHQTVEPTQASFAVIPEEPQLIKIAYNISKNHPIITFSTTQGFSNKGKTLIEYAQTLKIPALVYELGQKGFNASKADEFKKIILKLDLESVLTISLHKNIRYFHINDCVPNINKYRLLPGFESFQNLKSGQILAQNQQNEIFKCPKDCVLIFPRYQSIEEDEQELGSLAIEKYL